MPLPTNLTPLRYGNSGTQKEYEMFMQGDTFVSEPFSLLGHALTGVSQEISDPVTRTVIEKRRGRIYARSVVARVGTQTALTYTLGFGDALYTPALQWARSSGDCPKDFFILRLCPGKPDDLIAYVLPDNRADPPIEAVDFITNDDTEEVVTEQTTLRTTEKQAVWPLTYVAVQVSADELYGIDWSTEECAGCSFLINTDLVAVGGDGTAAGTIEQTDDRFSTSTTPTSNIPAGSTAEKIYSEGSVRLVGFRATTVSGGTVFSSDNGVTYTIDSTLTLPIFDVGKFGGFYFAVGGDTNGNVWTSRNGISWTAQGGSLTTPDVFTAFVVDKARNYAYVAGGAELYRITLVGSNVFFEDLSANLPGSPAGIVSLAVGRPGHLMVGGAAGYFAESFDDGVTWEDDQAIGASALTAIAASRNRTLIGSGTAVYERSILTGFSFDLKYTAGADVTDIAVAEDDPDNYFALTTEGGEVVFVKPLYPNS